MHVAEILIKLLPSPFQKISLLAVRVSLTLEQDFLFL